MGGLMLHCLSSALKVLAELVQPGHALNFMLQQRIFEPKCVLARHSACSGVRSSVLPVEHACRQECRNAQTPVGTTDV